MITGGEVNRPGWGIEGEGDWKGELGRLL